LDPVILAFLLPTTLKCYSATVFKFLQPVIFTNLPGSQNSQNKGHVKKRVLQYVEFVHLTSPVVCWQCLLTVCGGTSIDVHHVSGIHSEGRL